MNATYKPYLAEIDARIAEAQRWGDDSAARFARWQRDWILRQWRTRQTRARKGRSR